LWDALVAACGLEPTGYDDDLVEDVRATLGLPAGDIRGALVDRHVAVEELLHAVLVSLVPFSGMLSDLLRLYEMAAATHADHPNLEIEYDFGTDRPPLPFDLEAFRGWAESAASVTRRVSASLRSVDAWRLYQVLHDVDRQGLPDRPVNAVAREWVDVYEDGNWPTDLPHLTPSGRPSLDRLLRDVRAVAAEVLRRCRALSIDRQDLRRRWREPAGPNPDGVSREEVVTLGQIESDFLARRGGALDGPRRRVRASARRPGHLRPGERTNRDFRLWPGDRRLGGANG
jgi:hypothetical protein